MARFLHTADWQIGRQYGAFPSEEGSLLAAARFTAIETLAKLANTENVDAVLVAGDVFDTQTVSSPNVHRTFHAMSAFTGPWIMLPGNHDAALAESVWTRAQRENAVPANVHLLLEPSVKEFSDIGVAILAAPLTQRQTHDDLTQWFDQAETSAGLIRIGLAHGSVTGILPDTIDSPNPIAATRADTANLDYLALGDWHGLKQVNEHIWYSGTPEQERFRDNGAGQALIVEIDQPGDKPKVTPHPIGQHAWLKRRYSLAVSSDLNTMLAELEKIPEKSVLDLTLEGQLSLADHEQLNTALNALAGKLRSLRLHKDALTLHPTADDLASLKVDGYVGNVIDTLREQQNDAEEPIATEALSILAGILREQQGAES